MCSRFAHRVRCPSCFLSKRPFLVLAALAIFAVAFLLFDFGQDEHAQDLGAETAAHDDPRGLAEVELPIAEQAHESEASQREADFARMEVRGKLLDGTIIRGLNVMSSGPHRASDIAVPESDGATYIYGQDDERLHLELLYFSEEMGKLLEARADARLADGTVLVLPLAEPYARLTGLVVRDGSPLPHAKISLFGRASQRPIEVDMYGRFEILDSLPIRGELRFGDRAVPDARLPVEVNLGSAHELVFELPGGQLEIQAIPADGSEFRGAVMIVLYRAGADQDEERLSPRAMMSDERGYSRFQGLPPGEYWVEISRLTNSRSAPSVGRVFYQGGFVTEHVQMQTAAKLKVQVLPPPGMDSIGTRATVPLWEVRRDGIVVEEWDDALQVLLKSEERPWTTVEFQPGEMQIRVGDPEIGFADATVTLWPGLETELIVQLEKPAVSFNVMISNLDVLIFQRIQVVDEQGCWVGKLDAQSLLERQVFNDASGRASGGFRFNGSTQGKQAVIPFGIPSTGLYRFFGVSGDEVIPLGTHRISIDTKTLTLTLPE
jgi:hypothetical protein